MFSTLKGHTLHYLVLLSEQHYSVCFSTTWDNYHDSPKNVSYIFSQFEHTCLFLIFATFYTADIH